MALHGVLLVPGSGSAENPGESRTPPAPLGLLGVFSVGSIAQHEAAQHLRACTALVYGYTNKTDLEKYALHSVRVGSLGASLQIDQVDRLYQGSPLLEIGFLYELYT